MNTKFDLKVINESLNQKERISLGAYFLFVLGTDTVFTPEPTINSKNPIEQKYYEQGELLSYSAQLASQCLGEQGARVEYPKPHSYCTPSVDVLDGPTTLGTEIGDRIARGVFLLINALAQGKSTIKVAAHSRGAVESLLMTHELKRIYNAVNDPDSNKSFYDILLDTPCQYTKAAFQTIFSNSSECVIDKQSIKDALSDYDKKISMFLIDPVPGGRYYMLPYLRWYDARMYEQPPVPCELYIAKHERTRAFKVIIPKGCIPITFSGHHGTASGNGYDQKGNSTALINNSEGRFSILKLMLCKLMIFMDNKTSLLPTNKQIKLNHPELDLVATNFISSDKTQRQEQLFTLYETVQKYKDIFESYTYTSYGLGTECSETGERLVHWGSYETRSLNSVIPDLHGPFENAEHARLFLLIALGLELNENCSVIEIIEQLNVIIMNIIHLQCNQNNKLLNILNNEQTKNSFFEAFSLFIDTVSQKYLRNSLQQEEKQKILGAIKDTFGNIKKVLDTIEKNPIIVKLSEMISIGIKNTTETYYKTLMEQADKISRLIECRLDSEEEFQSSATLFIKALKYTKHSSELDQFITESTQRFETIKPFSINSFQEVYIEILNNPVIPEYFKKYLIDVDSKLEKRMDFYFQSTQYTAEDLLKELDVIFNTIQSFTKNKKHIQEIIPDYPIDANTLKMSSTSSFLIVIAAKVFKAFSTQNINLNLQKKPEYLSVAFYRLVRPQVIALGVKDPLVTKSIKNWNNTVTNNQRDLITLKKNLLLLTDQTTEIYKATKLIAEYLLPKTRKYLESLKDKINDHTPNTLIDINTELSESFPEKELKNTYNKVQKLYRCLTNPENPNPIDKLKDYRAQLDFYSKDPKLLENPDWTHYLKVCLMGIAIVFTGILPGAIGLTAYAMYKDKSSPLFFAKTEAEEYLDSSIQSVNRYFPVAN